MIYITLHRYGKPIIVNVEHIDWITDFDDYTEVAFRGGDNTLSVDEKASEVFSLLREVVDKLERYGR